MILQVGGCLYTFTLLLLGGVSYFDTKKKDEELGSQPGVACKNGPKEVEVRVIFGEVFGVGPVQRKNCMDGFCMPQILCYLGLSRWWFQIFFMFTPNYLGKWSNLTHIFQMGWKHQLVMCCPMFMVLPENIQQIYWNLGNQTADLTQPRTVPTLWWISISPKNWVISPYLKSWYLGPPCKHWRQIHHLRK